MTTEHQIMIPSFSQVFLFELQDEIYCFNK